MAQIADVAVVLARPNRNDLVRIGETARLLDEARVPSLVCPSQVRAGTLLADVAEEALADMAMVEPVPMREAVADAFGTQPGNGVLSLYEDLYSNLIALIEAE